MRVFIRTAQGYDKVRLWRVDNVYGDHDLVFVSREVYAEPKA